MCVTLALLGSRLLVAQDTLTVRARHVLPLDTARLQPRHQVYDMLVHSRDSSAAIGQREISFARATYAGNPAWLLVETRTGLVPAAETLYVTSEMRPLHWFSVVGDARLGATFVGDTILGAVSAPAGKRTLILQNRPDLLVSQAMAEMVLPLLPLAPAWVDSATTLVVDLAGGVVVASDLSVIGEEEVVLDSATTRPVWVVALRGEGRVLLFWVDKETGDVLRMQQPLPAHVGSLLEYRRRPSASPGR